MDLPRLGLPVPAPAWHQDWHPAKGHWQLGLYPPDFACSFSNPSTPSPVLGRSPVSPMASPDSRKACAASSLRMSSEVLTLASVLSSACKELSDLNSVLYEWL